MRRGLKTLRASALAAALMAAPAVAQAQATPTETSAKAKGIVGGGLLGAEAVMLVEAAAGVRTAWPYIVGGVAGAAGGAVGGYFTEDSNPKISLYLLAGGMTLIIPTTVAVLSRTAYEPPADYTEDKPPADEPVADPPQPTSSKPRESRGAATRSAARTPRPRGKRKQTESPQPVVLRPPPALIGVGEGSLSVSVPAVEVRNAYTQKEVAMYGVKQQTELRVPVVNVVF